MQLWLSVLLMDTSAATGQAGIRTHILTTPELESNALDRSATTLPCQWNKCVAKLSSLGLGSRFGPCHTNLIIIQCSGD